MSAQDAVDNGFADEIADTGQPVTMSINKNRDIMIVNGIPMSVKGFMNIPDYIQVYEEVIATRQPDGIKDTQIGGEKHMTLEELMKQEPRLVDQIRKDAMQSAQTDVQQAVNNELNRLKSIDEIAGKIADKSLVEKAKYGEVKMSAADLALEVLKSQNDFGQTFLNNMESDIKGSGAEKIIPAPTLKRLHVPSVSSAASTDPLLSDISPSAVAAMVTETTLIGKSASATSISGTQLPITSQY
mgnify:CR=1 FL=1